MKKLSLFICVSLFFLPFSSWALDETCDKKDYTCYKDYWVKDFCKGSTQAWNKNPGVGAVTDPYLELSSAAQKKQIADLVAKEKYPDEKTKLADELSVDRLGLFSGFKTVEIARIQYRTNMNRIFSCAVIASRIEKIQKVQNLIKSGQNTETIRKLNDDVKKLEQLKQSSCATNMDPSKLNNYSAALASSSTVEYCSYSNFLNYLDANIRNDYTNVLNIEKGIGTNGDQKPTPNTLDSMANSMNTYTTQIQSDLARAGSTLPKALVAFREMERTYTTHIMLMIIYDDYTELRQNLNTYLNAVSQLFEKAKNAQSANNQ